MAYKIYLCGGMTGLSIEAQKAWRNSVKTEVYQYVNENCVEFFDPTEYDPTEFATTPQEAEAVSMKLDMRNLITSNLVVCNISTNPLSVGTNIELGICHNIQIPVITFNPDGTSLHPWQEAISDFVVDDLEKLTEIICEYYLPKNYMR